MYKPNIIFNCFELICGCFKIVSKNVNKLFAFFLSRSNSQVLKFKCLISNKLYTCSYVI